MEAYMKNVEQSESIKSLSVALVAAQREMKPAAKDSTNPFFKSKYADLASVYSACREVLGKNGLAVVQFPIATADGAGVSSTLVHSSGEWMRAEFVVPVSKKDAQGFGSTLSYCRRYALAAIAGVVADEDDDGNAASATPAKAAPKAQKDHIAPASKLSPEYARLASGIAFAGDSSKVDVVAAEARDSAAKGLLTSSEATMLRDLFAAKRAAMSGKGHG